MDTTEHTATYLEWLGCISGLLGASMLASNTYLSKYGWWAFFVANLAMIGLAIVIDRTGLLIQQIGFTATSILGLHRAGLLKIWSR